MRVVLLPQGGSGSRGRAAGGSSMAGGSGGSGKTRAAYRHAVHAMPLDGLERDIGINAREVNYRDDGDDDADEDSDWGAGELPARKNPSYIASAVRKGLGCLNTQALELHQHAVLLLIWPQARVLI